jgi:hypothetical protein
MAEALRDWLPKVIQAVRPWLSIREIPKGHRGAIEIWEALEHINIGIICLTPENAREPWILFESGALSKMFSDTKTLVCTYLLGDLEHSELAAPLQAFQYTKPEKEDTRTMVRAINNALGDEPFLEENRLNEAFDIHWPELEIKIKTIPALEKDVVTTPNLEEALGQVPSPSSEIQPHEASPAPASPIPEWRPWEQTIWIKRKGIEELEYVDGRTYELTPEPGVLVIYRGPNVLAEFHDVEDWGFWGDNNGAEVKAKYKVDPKLG